MPASLNPLVTELIFQLNGGNAHAPLENVATDMPAKLQGVVPKGLPYSAWQLLEHLRIAQADIVEFCWNRNYREKKWPDDYWPKDAAPPSSRAWNAGFRQILADRKEFIELISNPKADLFAPLAWGQGQTLFGETCLIIDHNAYHLGEIVSVRRLLGAWPPRKTKS